MTTSSSTNSAGNGSRRRRARTLGILSGALGVLLSTASTPGQAEEPAEAGDSVRYDRESGKVKTKNNLETKFKAAAAEAEKDKKRKVDMLSADDFAKRKESVAREVADDQIQLMKALLEEAGPNSPEYPDYLFRLADLFLDKKAYFDNQSGALYEKIYEAEDAKKTAEAKQLKQRQAKFDGQSKNASADAVKVYAALVNKPQFGKYKRMDEALYFYAFELGQLERESEMQEAYLRLIREYPQSKYIPNAYLSFADFYYNKSQIKEALQLYQKIVDGYRDSPVYAYALYKMAWCYLNPVGTAEPEYAKSLDKFSETVKATLEGRAGSEGNAKQLRRDARRDMVKAYVHAGKPSKAQEFFEKIGDGPKKDENMSRKMLELLAGAYFGEGMYVESTATYKALQSKYDGDAMECTWQAAIVVNALASDDKNIQWKETEALGKYWTEYKDSKFKKATKKKCRDEARDTMVQMATVWHDEAEKTRQPATYALSEDAYRAFLQTFPEDKDAYEMGYYYAEIIWAQATNLYNSKDRKSQEAGLEKFKLAHDEFVRVLERKPDGKYTGDAAYAQMLAMKNHLEYDETGGRGKSCTMQMDGTCVYREKSVKKKKVTKDTKTDTNMEYPESPYAPDEESMLKAYDIYQKYVKKKDDAELPKIQYHRAKLMMEHNKFDEAKPVTIDLIEKHDGTVYAAWAGAMLIDLLTIKWSDKDNTPEQTIKTSEELEKWALVIQKKKLFDHKESEALRTQVPTLLAGIRWKKAEAYQEQGKQGDREGFVKCGEEYANIYNDYENHDRADTLLFNAARCFEAAYLLGNAVRARKALLDTFPDSQHYQLTLRELGENYQAIAYYGDAADRFEQYAGKFQKDEFASSALRNAYLFRLGLGEEEKAQADLVKYEDLYKRKDPKTAAKIFWSKHDLLTSDEQKMQHAKAYIKTYGGKGGSDRQAVAEAVIGQIVWRQSCEKELLYDSCLTVKRSKATAGEETRKKADKLRKKGKKGKEKKEEIPKYCGSATQGIITVHKRDGKLASEAQGHFASVLRLASKKADIPAEDNERAEAYKNAVGMAMVYKADQKYEDYLRINIPEGLEFNVEPWKQGSGIPKWEREYKEQLAKAEDSKKRFKEFYDSKSKLGGELVQSYAEVKSSGSPFWVLAAAARSAVLSQNFADQLYRAEVPASIKTEDEYFAYCDQLATFAEDAEKKAVEAFTYCLSKSTEFQFFNQFSRMCEEELQQRDPNSYPATNEMFGKSTYTDSRLDVVGVQVDLAGDKKEADTAKKKEGDKAGKKEDAEGGGKAGF